MRHTRGRTRFHPVQEGMTETHRIMGMANQLIYVFLYFLGMDSEYYLSHLKITHLK